MELSQNLVVWIIIGLVLVASEIFTGTFHLLFFGIAAFLMALFVYVGVEAIWLQITIFGLLSFLSFILVRKKFAHNWKGAGFQADLNQSIVLTDDIKANSEGIVQYQGAPWTAVNMDSTDLLKGQRATIVKTEGVKLFLRTNR